MSSTNLPLVMLVDDNEIDLFLSKKFLNVAGISDNTIAFKSAGEALEYIKANTENDEKLPSYILLDIQMPVMNGFQFLELFNKVSEGIKKGTKIIMLSSTVDPIDFERARSNKHVIDILRKPLDPAALKQLLNNNN